MSKTTEDENSLDADAHTRYRSALGVARFIADTVGHEISYITSALAAHQDRPSPRHMLALKRLGRFLKGNIDIGVKYSKQPSNSPPYLQAWVDADWAACPNTRNSRTGWLY